MSYFKNLSLKRWRQFESIDLDLSAQVTIVTGANGCGKTTILTLLSQHFGWNIPFASSPYVSKRSTRRLFRDVHPHPDKEHDENNNQQITVGEIKYETGETCILRVPSLVAANYRVEYQNQVKQPGLFIPSHRQQSIYNPVAQIPTNPVSAAQIFEQFRSVAAQIYQSGYIRGQKNPGLVQKEAIISLAVFGEGNSSIAPNHEYHDLFEAFQSRLRIIMPKEIGFRRIKINLPEVILETDSGDFSLDAMSGGVSALFSIAWQIQLFDLSNREYTIVIDEPENHLHPSMQRSILPALAEAFPSARFVIATHSPFIVSSFQNSNIFVLMYGDDRRVVSRKLDDAAVSGSANIILRDVLGVESTIPMWVEKIIVECLNDQSNADPEQQAKLISNRLEQLGIRVSWSDFHF